MKRIALAAIAGAALLAASCAGAAEVSPASPTGGPGALPTTSPGAATGTLSTGRLSLQMRGDVEHEATLTNLVTAVYAPPPSGFTIVWAAGVTTVGMSGATFAGTEPTSPALMLSISVPSDDESETFLSSAGECSVTIDTADATAIAGSFVCDNLEGGGGHVVEVSGSFEASG